MHNSLRGIMPSTDVKEEQGERATGVVVRVTPHLSTEESSIQDKGLQGWLLRQEGWPG